ncbi:hypothetical protein DV096_08955 [Bradymonadaceae bacterium TMQ3]|nr:hypothetical protein DV096_08955 [Bradymonadaceae bacterium TMQ3]TXC76317.1 hypothetical protein FRC91_06120 [Bradymonadales bacterium TMQ1]
MSAIPPTLSRALDALGTPAIDATPYLTILKERFGIDPAILDELVFIRANKRIVSVVHRDHQLPTEPRPDAVGLSFMRDDMAVPKLTTPAAMTFARYASVNVIDTTAEQCDAYLTRENFALSEPQVSTCTSRGYVLIRHRGHGLGVGFLRGTDPGEREVQSFFPKAWSQDVTRSAFGEVE